VNTESPNQIAAKEPAGSVPATHRILRWHKRVLGFCLVIFALEIGLFLLAFPWRREWEMSWIPVHSRSLAGLWMSYYFRGAISGLGLLNLAVAMAELSKQLKALRHRAN
jgi:hypothetical protein